METELSIPPAEVVDAARLRVDRDNPNQMSARQFRALKKSIQRWGFVVPIITNRDYLVADGEHRLQAAKALGMKQVSVVRLPVNDVDRRLIRQVMNKIRGEHDLFLDAEEYHRLVSEGARDLLKGLLNENDLRIDNLLRLRDPVEYSDNDLRELAENLETRVEGNLLNVEWEKKHPREPLTLDCHVEFSTKTEVTERTLAVCEAFGLGVDESQHFVVFDDFSLEFNRGDLIYITGDSGGGKSLLLKAFKKFFGDEAICLDDLVIDPEETLVEGVGKDVTEAIKILSFCGLNDAFLFLRRYKELSDGQKYRYKLAKLMNREDKKIWIIDEFCATLDRVIARVIAYLVQRFARKLGKTVVVATAHDDIVEDFQPDLVVEKGYERGVEVGECCKRLERCSICDCVQIKKGSIEDYHKLSRFHYRSKDENESEGLRVKNCFVLLFRDDVIGAIVYSRSYLNLKPRNMVFGDRYVFTPGDVFKARLINDEIARISRVVIHPKFRGIGLGSYLVKETMPRVDAKLIEALAVMAKYNPFFEKAGMVKVSYRRDETSVERRVRASLESKGFDFNLLRSKSYCRQFFEELDSEGRKSLSHCLSEFARQPFVKVGKITPELLARIFSSETAYFYWVNNEKLAKTDRGYMQKPCVPL